MDKVNEARLAELREIERKNGGVLQPEAVVDFARNPKTALHAAFEWDNSEAARKYRLEQARQLIRVTVEIEPHTGQEMRAYVAIREDRYEEGGYRHLPTMMRKESGRQSVLATALWELEAFEKKYKELKELSGIFSEIKKLKERKAA